MSAVSVATFRVLGLWLHLLAVVVWAGAMLGWMLVLLSEVPAEKGGAEWLEGFGRRVCTVGWEALFVILLTGIFNLLPRVQSGRLFDSAYTTPLLIKLSLVGGMTGLQLWQHGWVVPELGVEAENSPEWKSARHSAITATTLFLVLAAGALWIGVSLRY